MPFAKHSSVQRCSCDGYKPTSQAAPRETAMTPAKTDATAMWRIVVSFM